MVFIVSTGRSGSNFIAKKISTTTELKIDHQNRGSRIVNIIGNIALQEIISLNKAIWLLKFLKIDNLLYMHNSDPLRSVMVALLVKEGAYIKPKVIHIVRDPRDFVSSFMNWRMDSTKRKILHHFIPLWQPSPIFDPEMSFLDRLKMSKFEHFCWIWNFKNRLFSELNQFTNEYLFLKFDDLVNNDVKTLKELGLFLKIENLEVHKTTEKKNPSISDKFPKWKSWSKEQAKTMEKYCGELMSEFGYGNEEEWKRLIE